MIRVLIVEDSKTTFEMMESYFGSDPDLMVVDHAENGKVACDLVANLNPDIILMDLHMPVMDGLEATKVIMAYYPKPILLMSSSSVENNSSTLFQALSYGALDVVSKYPFESEATDKEREDFVQKVKILSRINVIHHPLAKLEKNEALYSKRNLISKSKTPYEIIAIVSSTGGPSALVEIFKRLPENFPIPIVLVQHISPGFAEGLVSWLQSQIKLDVKLAQENDCLEKGIIYLSPSDYHISISPVKKIELREGDVVDGHCPSGTVLLSSIAESFGEKSIGIILTGMGRDGVAGMKAIFDKGGMTLVQDEKSSIIYGMPKEAMDLGYAKLQLDLEGIAQKLIEFVS